MIWIVKTRALLKQAAMNRYREGSQISQYALNISIPKHDGRHYLSKQHRMSIVLSQGERNLNSYDTNGCGYVRDYAI